MCVVFKKGYLPRAYVKKEDNGTIVADTTSSLTRWGQFYSNLINVNQSISHKERDIFTESQTSKKLVFYKQNLL